MTVKEHYENHLGNFYSWYVGNFEKNKDAFGKFCTENEIKPESSKQALDLGAGNGIQSIALAEIGFQVTAIDFNQQLLTELELNAKDLPVTIVNDDFRNLLQYSALIPELIVCCGDTLSHLDSKNEIAQFLSNCNNILEKQGKLILTFRDYSFELEDTERFIHVNSDNNRVFTCFLEYFADKVRVTDLLYELENGKWVQKVSSYFKIRLNENFVIENLKSCGFSILLNMTHNRMIHIIAQK